VDPATNKAIARRYFTEMVDERSDKLLEELWTEDCVVHRPEVSATIKGRETFRQAFNRVVGPCEANRQRENTDATLVKEVASAKYLPLTRLSRADISVPRAEGNVSHSIARLF
jgi:hypothetical protein